MRKRPSHPWLPSDAISVDPTLQLCADLCEDSAYFGTQWSTECWCSGPDQNSAFNMDYAALGEGVCDMACPGDSTEICGGFFAQSVYANFENVVY